MGACAGNDTPGKIGFWTTSEGASSPTESAYVSWTGEITQLRYHGTAYPAPTASMNISGGNVDIADDTTLNMQYVANSGALLDVGSYRQDGGGVVYASALFYITYGSNTVVKLADPRGIFDVADTDGKVCVYKASAASGTFTIKNRMGSTANKLSVNIIRFSGL